MTKRVPFTVHIKIYPARGKRFVHVRDMQKTAELIYDGILNVSGVNVANPGGGQQRSYTNHSGYVDGMAVKPQFGQVPAQVSITGFNEVDAANDPPHADISVIHTNSLHTGYGGSQPHQSGPTSTVDDEVAALKTAMESAITAALPSAVTYEVFRLDYNGVIYGDKGYTFPRS